MAKGRTISNREELSAAPRQNGEKFDEAFERGVYEQCGSARQPLAYIAAMQWTYPRQIERAE